MGFIAGFVVGVVATLLVQKFLKKNKKEKIEKQGNGWPRPPKPPNT